MALEQLRAFRAGVPLVSLGATTTLPPDGFPLLAESELARQHEVLSDLLSDLLTIGWNANAHQLPAHPAVDRLLAESAEMRTRTYLALLERIFAYDARLGAVDDYRLSGFMDYGGGANLLAALHDAGVDSERVSIPTLEWFTTYRFVYYGVEPVLRTLKFIASSSGSRELGPELRDLLVEVHGQCRDLGGHASMAAELEAAVAKILGPGCHEVLAPCEAWSAAATRELEGMDASQSTCWLALLAHAKTATSARPSSKWMKTGRMRLEEVGAEALRAAMLRWIPLVDAGRGRAMAGPSWENVDERARMHEGNATILRGLCWLAPLVPDERLTRALGKLALSAYRKVRGIGPRATKVGNASIFALSQVHTPASVGQLAVLKVRVKFVPAQKEIDKAFNAAAEALGLPREEIEEMAVPTYGLEEIGIRREILGDGSIVAELKVEGTDVAIRWSRGGKPVKSVPAAAKKSHKEEVRELTAARKDIASMLSAQSERIDALFLREPRWPLAEWRQRYIDHPLVGTLARRLIWSFEREGCEGALSGLAPDGRLVDVQGNTLAVPADALVSLWHPIGRDVAEVLAWRNALEALEIRQPFKQAHREVYLLTDAERTTRTYSNRFAAHVLRQHQFNALCGGRGWRNKLRLMVDDTYPPATRDVPRFGLRAEFWIEGIGDDYGTDTNEAGAYLRLASDQVRFYRAAAADNSAHAGGGGYASTAAGPGRDGVSEPVGLESVPPLVFSEIMRDVDLFVGVTSIGNDPTWQDGGPEGQFRTYWQSFSFGELGETAKTRREVLSRLLPRLKIARQCELSDRFLVVRGELRTYKIHLGSGNILMEPNDEYLCIVPDRGAAAGALDGRVFLPFEGDSTLSIVLSKALLLARDVEITDPSIRHQLAGS